MMKQGASQKFERCSFMPSLSKQAQECHVNAARCVRNAMAAQDAAARDEFLEMERRWLSLADCYQSSKRLSAERMNRAGPAQRRNPRAAAVLSA
jgi:hypothetical protein